MTTYVASAESAAGESAARGSAARRQSAVADRGTASQSSALRASWPVVVSWVLGVILVAAALYGLIAEDAYRVEEGLAAASRGQDILTLVAVPVLVWAGYRSRAGSLRGHLAWLGVLAYVAYSYLVYAIGFPQNDAFLLYTAAVSLSVAALLDGLVRIDMATVAPAFVKLRRRRVGWFLVVTGAVFALLWLADIAPTIPGDGVPAQLGPGEVPFAIYVLDLTFALPAVIATGVALLRGHPAGPVLGVVVLAKILTLGLAIEAMAAAMLLDGLRPDPASTGLFAVLVPVCGAVLVRAARRLAEPGTGWLRPTLWNHGGRA